MKRRQRTLSVPLLARVGAAGCLAASGLIHAQLYLHGYRTIPGIGPAFLLQASGSLAVALLLLISCAAVLRFAATTHPVTVQRHVRTQDESMRRSYCSK
jgi:hypothetical protein